MVRVRNCGRRPARRPTRRAPIPCQAIANLTQGAQWKEASCGRTPDCRLNWVVVGSGDASDSLHQVLFLDRNTPLGPATPQPRPYINVTTMRNDTVIVQTSGARARTSRAAPQASARFGSRSATMTRSRHLTDPQLLARPRSGYSVGMFS